MSYQPPENIGDLLERYSAGERHFPECDFEHHENLQNLNLNDVNFERSYIFSADFSGTSFRNANLKDCSFKCCQFINVDFTNADLSGSLLSGAIFVNCIFDNVNLDGADWYGHSLKTEEFLNVINSAEQK